MKRVRDPEELRSLLLANAPPSLIADDFDPAGWAENALCLRIENDLAIFEDVGPGELEGHIFFESRGRKALDRANAIIAALFASGIHIIHGKTPIQCRGALAFIRLLGFEAVGEEMHPKGKMIVSRIANPKSVKAVA